MANDLVRQLQKNHEILLAKIASIESMVADKLPKQQQIGNNGGVGGGDITANNNEKQLLIENQNLRNEIQRLIQKLTQLEMNVKTDDEVLSLDSLKKISKTNQTQSAAASIPVDPPTTQSQTITSETKTEKPQKQQQQQQQQTKKDKKSDSTKPKDDNKQPKESSKPKSAGGGGGKSSEQTEERAIDASRLDLRVGKIISVEKHPDADTLYVEQIDCGESKPRTVVSGLVKFVPLDQMQNRMVVILCNLKPAKMRGVVSEAMVMCASTPERVEILTPPEGSVPGDRVTFGKYPGQPDQQLNPKKKIWEQIAPDLKTNDNLEATYKGDSFLVEGKGTVKAETLKNVQVK